MMADRCYPASSSARHASLRRVSFQTENDAPVRRRCVGLTRSSVTTGATIKNPHTFNITPPPSILKKSVTVLHGRVVKQQRNDNVNVNNEDTNNIYGTRSRSNDSALLVNHRPSGIRDSMQRKSTFYQLTEETRQFQTLVSKLESLLKGGDGQTTAEQAAWRVRVLLKTAQESDKSLWAKLYEFEKTLLSTNDKSNGASRYSCNTASPDELLTAQTECMKLHRDFKRSHKALLMCQSLAERKNIHNSVSPTTVGGDLMNSPLGDVGWTGGGVAKEEEQQRQEMQGDLGHRCGRMRQRSPEAVYTSFQEVKTKAVHVYKDVPDDFKGPLLPVEEQDNDRYEAVDVEQTPDEDGFDFLCGAMGFSADDTLAQEADNYNRWYKNLKKEFSSIQRDIFHVGSSLGCVAPTQSEYDMASTRFASARQASF